MIEIQAPNQIKIDGFSIFLAGSIDMGTSIDWQNELVARLLDYKGYLYNPRRKDWDSSWEQKIENGQFIEQVEWELDAMDKADLIIYYFAKDSKSPITLLELGLHKDDNIIVCCPEGFYRKGNVDIVCKKYNIKTCKTLNELVIQIINELK